MTQKENKQSKKKEEMDYKEELCQYLSNVPDCMIESMWEAFDHYGVDSFWTHNFWNNIKSLYDKPSFDIYAFFGDESKNKIKESITAITEGSNLMLKNIPGFNFTLNDVPLIPLVINLLEFFFKNFGFNNEFPEFTNGLFGFFLSFLSIDYPGCKKYLREVKSVKKVDENKYQFDREEIAKNVMIMTQILVEKMEGWSINIAGFYGFIGTVLIWVYITLYVLLRERKNKNPEETHNIIESFTSDSESKNGDRNLTFEVLGKNVLHIVENLLFKVFTVSFVFQKKGYRGYQYFPNNGWLLILEAMHPNFFDVPENYYTTDHAIHKHEVYKSCIYMIERIQEYSKNPDKIFGFIPMMGHKDFKSNPERDRSTMEDVDLRNTFMKGSIDKIAGVISLQGLPFVKTFLHMRSLELIAILEKLDKPDLTVRTTYNFVNQHDGSSLNNNLIDSQELSTLANRNYHRIDNKEIHSFDDVRDINGYNHSMFSKGSSYSSYASPYGEEFPSRNLTSRQKKIKAEAQEIMDRLRNSRDFKLGTKDERTAGSDSDKLTLRMYQTLSRSKTGREFLKNNKLFNDLQVQKVKKYHDGIIIESRKRKLYWPSFDEIEKIRKLICINHSPSLTMEEVENYLKKKFPQLYIGQHKKLISNSSSISRISMNSKISSSVLNSKNLLKKIIKMIIDSDEIDNYENINEIKEVVDAKIEDMTNNNDFIDFLTEYYKIKNDKDLFNAIQTFKDITTKHIFDKYKTKLSHMQKMKKKFLSSKIGQKMKKNIDTFTQDEINKECQKFLDKQVTKTWVSNNLKQEGAEVDSVKKQIMKNITKELKKNKSESSHEELQDWLNKEIQSLN